MSYFLLDGAAVAPNRPAAPVPTVPSQAPRLDRRRPGRIENASSELITLMRKPSQAARLRVALYDAPGFLLQAEPVRPRVNRRSMAVAGTACSVLSAAAFGGMLMLWG